jgi:glycosyltransferase involved in cell wall biosynthesis
MPTYQDFDGVYFTLQSLRLFHDLSDTELLVVDNYGCEYTKKFVEKSVKGRYILSTDVVGTSQAKNVVLQEARGEAVLCCDSHVMFFPGAIARLKQYYREHPDCQDLLQGPIVYDNLKTMSTHLEPTWRGQFWGIWSTDPRGEDPDGEPFEIPMQGTGAFSCRKSVWPGYSSLFRGFGGEAGYIHEKFRQQGGRCLCLPWFRWTHRFDRPKGVPYPLTVDAKLRNYIIGHAELGLDIATVVNHFAEHLPRERVDRIAAEAVREVEEARRGITPARPTPASDARLPLVSAICLTYGRPPDHQYLLEEAIESFLRQTYPNKELIILNDCPGQELVCDAPGVRVVNVAERFPTLGDKRNAAVAQAAGELIAPWDDDDISLPWRLSLSVERLGNAGYFNPKLKWFMDGRGIRPEQTSNVEHNLSLFTREAFKTIGGYPSTSAGEDSKMDSALRSKVAYIGKGAPGYEQLERSEVYYIFRWGVSPDHLSNRRVPDDPESQYQHIGSKPAQPGRFVLRPHWHVDYEAETRRLLER